MEWIPIRELAAAVPAARTASASAGSLSPAPGATTSPLVGAVLRLDPPAYAHAAARGVGLVAELDCDQVIVFSVRFPRPYHERYDAAVATLLRRLGDDIVLSLRTTRSLQNRRHDGASAIEAGWDRLAAGVMLLCPRLRILIANAAADDLLADRRFFLPPVAGSLRPAVQADAEQLQEAAARLADGENESEHLTIGALRGSQRLMIRLSRLDRPSIGHGSGHARNVEDRLIAIIEQEAAGEAETVRPSTSSIAALRSVALQVAFPGQGPKAPGRRKPAAAKPAPRGRLARTGGAKAD
jgi:hypothetical protein